MAKHDCTSIADLVRLVGVDQSALSRYLSGQSEPSLDNLRKLSSALGLTLGDLMVAAGIATREALGMVPTTPQRLAPVLRAVQDFLDDKRSTGAGKQFLLKGTRGLLDLCIEARDGVPQDAVDRPRRR